jgi:hypothetical protein
VHEELTLPNPDLSNYYGTLRASKSYKLQAKTGLWINIGTASFSTLSPETIALSADYSAFGNSGNIALNVEVTGDCSGRVTINGHALDCTFAERGSELVVRYQSKSGKEKSISFSWEKRGILIDGDVLPVKVLVKA